jgi:hypothetical protein
MLGHGFLHPIWLGYCIQLFQLQPANCLHFLVDGLSTKAYVPTYEASDSQ